MRPIKLLFKFISFGFLLTAIITSLYAFGGISSAWIGVITFLIISCTAGWISRKINF